MEYDREHRRGRGGRRPRGRGQVSYGWGVPVRGMYNYSPDYGGPGGPETDSESIPGYDSGPDDWTGPRPHYESHHWAAAEPAGERRLRRWQAEWQRSRQADYDDDYGPGPFRGYGAGVGGDSGGWRRGYFGAPYGGDYGGDFRGGNWPGYGGEYRSGPRSRGYERPDWGPRRPRDERSRGGQGRDHWERGREWGAGPAWGGAGRGRGADPYDPRAQDAYFRARGPRGRWGRSGGRVSPGGD